jgi:hypothetical protein
MIPKASQRANGQQLAIHLLNAHDNERVDVAHIRGAIARDLPGAFEEWHAVSRATRCKKYLYSLSINPDPKQGALTRRQYKDYIARVEKKLGLAGQPRAIVFHTKEGREHCHVVWSRIIPGQLKAVQISHDRKSLQTITRRFAKDHGLALPDNMRENMSSKELPPPQNITLAEKQQQERTGLSKEDRVRTITKIWQETATAGAFVEGLRQAGYHLARGDSVPYVVVDSSGEIHSLPRQIEGARTRDIKARLVDYPANDLAPAAAIQEQVRHRLRTEITSRFNRNAEAPFIHLRQTQETRRTAFHARLAALKEKHQAERTAMSARQKDRLLRMRELRLRDNATGFMAILCAIPGIRTLIARRHRKHDLSFLNEHRKERRSLIACQRAEFEDVKRQARAIRRVEKRELRSLKTKIHRDFLQARLPAAAPVACPADPAIPHPQQAEKIADFVINARDLTQPAAPRRTRTTPPRHRKPPAPDSLTASFARPVETPSLRPVFAKAARPPDKAIAPHVPRPDLPG